MRKFFSRFFNGKNSLSAASLILIITLFLSNVLGLLRDHYLTQKIPTDTLSVYYAAFRIPDLIFNVLILGAISAAFIPIFSTLITNKRHEEAWKTTNSVINIAIIMLICSCLVLVFLMPFIVPLFVHGFSPVEQQLTVKLARIMLASPIFFGLSYIFGAILNSFKRFTVYSLSPLVYNISIILGTLYFADRFSVTGVAVAVVCGAFLHMAIQIPIAIKLGFRWQPILDLKDNFVRRIGHLMLPRALGLGANQILLIFFTSIASGLTGSAVAVYNLSDNIQTMPMVVFGTSFAMAIFPTLSEKASENDHEAFSSYFAKSLRSILFFMIPIVFGTYLLKEQIVRLILGSGHFGWNQTLATSSCLGYFALALAFTSLVPLLARAFYAIHDTRIPMIATVLTVIISIATGYILTPKMGVGGLAIAYSIGGFFNAGILYVLLRSRIKINERPLAIFVGKILLSSIVMAVAMWEAIVLTAGLDMHHFYGVLAQTVIAVAIGVIIFLILAWVLNCEEINSIKIVLSRLTGRSIAQDAERGR